MSGARTVIKNGLAQGDFDMGGYHLLNLGSGGGGLGEFVPVTRSINGHQLTSDIVLDLATDFGLSVSALGLNMLTLPTPGVNSYIRVDHLDTASYLTPAEVLADIGGVSASNRSILTSLPLTGGGSLTSNRTITLGGLTAYGTARQMLIMNGTANGMEFKSLAAGTSGSDFNIAAAGADIVFNLPTASALNRGLLSSADWIAFNAKSVNPMSATGDLVYGGASGTPTRLAGQTTATRKFLRQIGNGTISAAPEWDNVTRDDIVGLGPTSDAVFGNVFVGTNGDFSGLDELMTVGIAMDALGYLAFENSEYVSLKDKASGFGAYFDTSLLLADRTLKIPNRNGTLAVSEWKSVHSTYTAAAGDKLQANTVVEAFTVNLPAAPIDGDSVQIEDATENWATNNLTIGRNGSNINGAASDYVGNTNGKKLSCVYVEEEDYGWSIK